MKIKYQMKKVTNYNEVKEFLLENGYKENEEMKFFNTSVKDSDYPVEDFERYDTDNDFSVWISTNHILIQNGIGATIKCAFNTTTIEVIANTIKSQSNL